MKKKLLNQECPFCGPANVRLMRNYFHLSYNIDVSDIDDEYEDNETVFLETAIVCLTCTTVKAVWGDNEIEINCAIDQWNRLTEKCRGLEPKSIESPEL